MDPGQQSSPMMILVYLATAAVASGFTLPFVCNLFGLNAPTFKKGIVVSVLVGAGAFFLFDLFGYGIVLATQDVSHVNLPAGYTYMHWLAEPLYLKWQVMGLVPLLRYLPLVAAICLGGTIYVFVLLEPFRLCTVVFVLQWALNVLAAAVVGYVLGKTGDFVNRPELPGPMVGQQQPGGYPQLTPGQMRALTRPSQQYMPQGPGGQRPQGFPKGPSKKGKSVKKEEGGPGGLAQVLTEQKADLGPVLEKIRASILVVTHSLDPYLERVRQASQPYTQYLPAGVQEFLDDGGWWLVMLALALVFFFWGRRLLRRVRRIFARRKKRHKDTVKKMRIELEQVGDAFTEAGPCRIRVGNFTGRLRLVVLAPSASFVGELLPDMAENLLDYLLPGLGEIIEYDQPKTVVWPRQSTEGQFAGLFGKLVQPPETEGRPSPWVLVSGSTRLGRQTLFVGLAVFMDRIIHRRDISIDKGKWDSVLGLEKAAAAV